MRWDTEATNPLIAKRKCYFDLERRLAPAMVCFFDLERSPAPAMAARPSMTAIVTIVHYKFIYKFSFTNFLSKTLISKK